MDNRTDDGTEIQAGLHIHHSLITITEQTHLEDFHLLIIALRRQELYVVRDGKLLGAVSREAYKRVMNDVQQGSHSILHCCPCF